MSSSELNFSLILDTSDALNQFVAGAVGGLAGLAVGHPMDTVKILMQNSEKKTTARCVYHTIRKSGMGSFFRGLSLPLYSYSFLNAYTFATYKTTVGLLDASERTPLATACSGAVAGIAQLAPSVPIEVIKIHQQAEATNQAMPRGLSVTQCVRQIVRTNGWRGLYAGSIMQAARDVPAFASYFFAYAECNKLGESYGIDSLLTTFYAGALSGAISWMVSMPMDVLKTRIQAGTETTIREAYMDLIRAEGYLAFFRGFNVVIARALLVNACVFVVYEEVYKWLNISPGSSTVKA